MGFDSSISSGFEAWRQIHLEYMLKLKESGINHMVSSLSANLARDDSDLRSKFYEAQGHLREADALKGSTVSNETKKVASMKIPFQDSRLPVRRQGLHSDKYIYDELRALLMEQASIKDGERAVKGSIGEFIETPLPQECDQGSWLEGAHGEWIWLEPAQPNALFKGKGKGNGKG